MTKFQESGLDIEMSRSQIVSEVLNKIQAMGGYFVRKLSKDEIKKCSYLSPHGNTLLPKKKNGPKNGGLKGFRYVVVPGTVAVDKTKQSIRFQLKVMNRRQSGTGTNKEDAVVQKQNKSVGQVIFCSSPTSDKKVAAANSNSPKLTTGGLTVMEPQVGTALSPRDGEKKETIASLPSSFGTARSPSSPVALNEVQAGTTSGTGLLSTTTGTAASTSGGIIPPTATTLAGVASSAAQRLVQLAKEEQKYTNLLHAAVFAQAAQQLKFPNLSSASNGAGAASHTPRILPSPTLGRSVLDPFGCGLLGARGRIGGGGLGGLLAPPLNVIPPPAPSIAAAPAHSFTTSAVSTPPLRLTDAERGSILRMIVERADDIVRETEDDIGATRFSSP